MCKVPRRRYDNNIMAHLLTDIGDLYETYFAKPYYVDPKGQVAKETSFGMPLSERMLGMEVFLPVTLSSQGVVLQIPCCTIRVTCSKTVVKTALSERVGTVKEQFSVGDYQFAVKGVLIAGNGFAFPDRQIYTLRQFFESTTPVTLSNTLADLFLDTSQYVCMTSLEFPETSGDLKHRPFTFTAESDYIQSLSL